MVRFDSTRSIDDLHSSQRYDWGAEMNTKRNPITQVLIVLLVMMALILPTAAAAGKKVYQDKEYIAPNTTEMEDLSAGPVYVTIPAGALPEGGKLSAKVKIDSDGSFEADFKPDTQFATDIVIDFGPNVTVVYYWDDGVPVLMELVNGKLITDHFSRYSGW